MSFFIAFLLVCVDLHLLEVRSTWLHDGNRPAAAPHHYIAVQKTKFDFIKTDSASGRDRIGSAQQSH
jgi:hypothetical protein